MFSPYDHRVGVFVLFVATALQTPRTAVSQGEWFSRKTNKHPEGKPPGRKSSRTYTGFRNTVYGYRDFLQDIPNRRYFRRYQQTFLYPRYLSVIYSLWKSGRLRVVHLYILCIGGVAMISRLGRGGGVNKSKITFTNIIRLKIIYCLFG